MASGVFFEKGKNVCKNADYIGLPPFGNGTTQGEQRMMVPDEGKPTQDQQVIEQTLIGIPQSLGPKQYSCLEHFLFARTSAKHKYDPRDPPKSNLRAFIDAQSTKNGSMISSEKTPAYLDKFQSPGMGCSVPLEDGMENCFPRGSPD